jgi:hypothetical protein
MIVLILAAVFVAACGGNEAGRPATTTAPAKPTEAPKPAPPAATEAPKPAAPAASPAVPAAPPAAPTSPPHVAKDEILPLAVGTLALLWVGLMRGYLRFRARLQ